MKLLFLRFIAALFLLFSITSLTSAQSTEQPILQEQDDDQRMDWWRDSRFGLFIHWGLYSVPEGEWNGKTHYNEWIRRKAQIPINDYDKFRSQFNPTDYDPQEWVRLAKQAGMKYIVITSKHHDGFCLWPSDQTDFDIENTAYGKDLLGPLKEACDAEGIKLCFYHSIMDWHHPDYLPRMKWEAADRPTDEADYDRYVAYMKSQLKELLDNYGPIGVMWFDGEWEKTWTHDRGVKLYDYVRGLQDDIIINNRVDSGRKGMSGFNESEGEVEYAGDFGTPEQQIPATGFPGVDWEACMTMNSKWGWNKSDKKWKSSTDLIRKLIDISSKGGNFLLNVGPKPDGTFPAKSIKRLEKIGEWMAVNGEAIYGTKASPFENLPWGRCTQKLESGKTTLYLHVFNWPANGKLKVPGLVNQVKKAELLADKTTAIMVSQEGNDCLLKLPASAPDQIASVIRLEIEGEPTIRQPNDQEAQ